MEPDKIPASCASSCARDTISDICHVMIKRISLLFSDDKVDRYMCLRNEKCNSGGREIHPSAAARYGPVSYREIFCLSCESRGCIPHTPHAVPHTALSD